MALHESVQLVYYRDMAIPADDVSLADLPHSILAYEALIDDRLIGSHGTSLCIEFGSEPSLEPLSLNDSKLLLRRYRKAGWTVNPSYGHECLMSIYIIRTADS